MIKRKLIIISMMIALITLLSGCKDKSEIEEQAYVSTIGIDKGKNNNLSVTFQIVNAKYGGGSSKSQGGSSEEKAETVTFDAPDLISARDLANVSVARRITLAQAKVLVIGEELAKDEEFFQIIEATLRERELRRGIDMIVSIEEASEFINGNSPKLEDRVNKFYDFMSSRWSETGFVPLSDINRYVQRTGENTSLFLAVYGTTKKFLPKEIGGFEADYLPGRVGMKGGNPTELIGAAVFKSGKMIGSITGEENRLVSLLRAKSDVESMIYTFEDPKEDRYRITTRIIKDKKTKIRIDINENKPQVYVNVPVKIEVLSIPSLINYVEDLKKQKILKESIRKQLEEKSDKFIKKTQINFKGEPFQWELELRKNFLTYEEYKDYDWLKKYPEAEVIVNFDVKIKGFGKKLSPGEMPKQEADER